ncbi:glial cell line-derived neurotrophic factor [Paramormyrops kingsleyae]|uniref:glial cell line-derived neurotrophic factor n=1 Tax=Paramormyrops kingsleyae TaxID=1676925 RepID=UPI003B97A4A0
MKLWDILALCVSLGAVSARPARHRLPAENHLQVLELKPERGHLAMEGTWSEYQQRGQENLQEPPSSKLISASPLYPGQLEDVMDFIQTTLSRLPRASEWDESTWAIGQRGRRRGGASRDGMGRIREEKKKGRSHGRNRRRGQGQVGGGGSGCVLKQVHLNVTDLGLGYRTKEELLFRYCSGPCADSETNYDKILNNLSHNKKLTPDNPARTCCRPIAFDDDLSFLDDDLVYHTLKKHSARKCACI